MSTLEIKTVYQNGKEVAVKTTSSAVFTPEGKPIIEYMNERIDAVVAGDVPTYDDTEVKASIQANTEAIQKNTDDIAEKLTSSDVLNDSGNVRTDLLPSVTNYVYIPVTGQKYNVNDIIHTNGNIYKCIEGHTYTGELDSEKWSAIDDIVKIQEDLLQKGLAAEALEKRVEDNEKAIEEIGSDIDSIDEDIDALEKDVATIKTNFMETEDYLVDGQFEALRLPIWSDENFNKINPALYDASLSEDEVKALLVDVLDEGDYSLYTNEYVALSDTFDIAANNFVTVTLKDGIDLSEYGVPILATTNGDSVAWGNLILVNENSFNVRNLSSVATVTGAYIAAKKNKGVSVEGSTFTKLSELENDTNFVNETQLQDAIDNIDIPEGGAGLTEEQEALLNSALQPDSTINATTVNRTLAGSTGTYYPSLFAGTSTSTDRPLYASTGLSFTLSTGTLNSTAFNVTSDKRFKEVLSPMESMLDTIEKINLIEYKYNKDYMENSKQYYGVLAQELEELLPTMVNSRETERYYDERSIEESKLVYIALKGIQELSEEVKVLKEEIKNLRGE